MEEWPTIRRFPRTLHEAFPGHGDYAEWFYSHRSIRPITELVVAVIFVITLLFLAIKVV